MDNDDVKRLRGFYCEELESPFEGATVISYDFGRPPQHYTRNATTRHLRQHKQAATHITVRYRDFALKLVVSLEYERFCGRDIVETDARVFVHVSTSGPRRYDPKALADVLCRRYATRSQLGGFVSRHFAVRALIHKKLLYCSSRSSSTALANVPSPYMRS